MRHAMQQRSAPPAVTDVLRAPGRPLDTPARSFFESRFQHDFSRVRVHDDTAADRSAQDLAARAWTYRNDVAFARGMYEPSTAHGMALLDHELQHVVEQEGLAEPRTAQVQRSAWSTFLDVALFIPRLFGLETFPAEDLRKYLDGLKKRKGPQKSLFSDNMARACVSREKEFGPYDTDTKVWLIEDMLHGWTTFLDENAIIDLLKRSGDRAQIVARIGRNLLWDNFSGKNLREIKGVTFTKADFTPAMIEKLRDLPANQLQDYVRNAVDPDVQQELQKIVQLQGISTPVPGAVTIEPGGIATIQIGGADIRFEPDELSTDEKNRDHAYTNLRFPPASLTHESDTKTGIVKSYTVTPPRTLAVIKTLYGPNFGPKEAAGWGRGTTPEDVFAGTTSARFHEGRHGLALIEYLRANPVPQFVGATGIPLSELQQKWADYNDALKKYIDAATEYTAKNTDCVGPKKIPPEELQAVGLSVTLCEGIE